MSSDTLTDTDTGVDGIPTVSDTTDREHEIRRLRDENAARRVANRDLTAGNQQLQADLQAMQERLSSVERDLQDSRDLLEQEQRGRKEERDALITANQAVIDSLPARLQKVVPTDYDPFQLRRWLDASVPELTIVVPRIDGEPGARTDRASDAAVITQDIAEFARLAGLDPQQLATEMKKAKK